MNTIMVVFIYVQTHHFAGITWQTAVSSCERLVLTAEQLNNTRPASINRKSYILLVEGGIIKLRAFGLPLKSSV